MWDLYRRLFTANEFVERAGYKSREIHIASSRWMYETQGKGVQGKTMYDCRVCTVLAVTG